MLFEIPLLFAPSFYKLDLSELPVLICTFYLGPVAGVVSELLKVTIKLILKGTTTAFVLDSSGDVGKVIVGAPGQIKIFADVVGKRAHAGLAPEQGISAIQVAAKGIAKMNLLRIDEETTCNIGTIKAEYATNIVPDRVSLVAEVRSRNFDKLNAQAAHMKDCLQAACDEAGAQLEIELRTNYVSYRVPEDSETVKMVLDAAERVGVKGFTALGGGGSDANIFKLKYWVSLR